MQIKPNKWKVVVALIPVYLFVLTLPAFIQKIAVFLEKMTFGSVIESISALSYLAFLFLLIPFSFIFKRLGLYGESGGWFSLPEINPFGLLLLALIYSSLIYLLISVFQKKN